MTSEQRKTIWTTACEVRQWLETMYETKRHDDEWSSDMAGMCAIGSFELLRRLFLLGIKARIAYGRYHSFVIYHGYVVDVTASQFRDSDRPLPDVVIRRLRDCRKKDLWFWSDFKHTFSFPDKQGISKAFLNWPRTQRPLMKEAYRNRE